MIKKILASSILLSSATLPLEIFALQLTGTKEVNTLTKQTRPGFAASQEIPVSLMSVKLSKEEVAALQKEQRTARKVTLAHAAPLPSKSALNFEKFPVLNQGQHGSCVTFASVAALNYVLNKPNHVSSLCSLTLGSTLEKNGYYPSGWDGSFGPMVLDQFMRFGYISTTQQSQFGCGGLKEYPTNNGRDTGKPMALDEYKKFSKSFLFEQLSINTGAKIFWSPIVSMEERFNLDETGDNYDGEKALTKVKQALLANSTSTKNIVTLGTLLYGDLCHAGACAKHSTQDDTWAMSRSIVSLLDRGFGPDSGHEVAIIGYDDNATAVDRDGTVHKGLLTIRNSWGTKAGDNGNYYMTYDYFKTFVDEVQKVSRVVLTVS